MSKANESAFPVDRADGESGLTKREYFALHCLQTSILANVSVNKEIGPLRDHTQDALDMADALLTALNNDDAQNRSECCGGLVVPCPLHKAATQKD